MRKIEVKNMISHDGMFEWDVYLDGKNIGGIAICDDWSIGGSYDYELLTEDEERELMKLVTPPEFNCEVELPE